MLYTNAVPMFGNRKHLGTYLGLVKDSDGHVAFVADVWFNKGQASIVWGNGADLCMTFDIFIPHEDKMLVVHPPVLGKGTTIGDVPLQGLIMKAFDLAMPICQEEILMDHAAFVIQMWTNGEILARDARIALVNMIPRPGSGGLIIDAADLDAPPED